MHRPLAEAAVLFIPIPPMSNPRKLLLLSIGYGEGHHAAARALAETFADNGWMVRTEDVCRKATPRFFRLTQRFYHFCVRRMPWLWRVTYDRTENADWRRMLFLPGISAAMRVLECLLREYRPDMVICTYPLFAYMLDVLRESGRVDAPYAVVVTDALEISRPWMKSHAPLICVPDEHSLRLVCSRYGLAEDRVVATGFPVAKAFSPAGQLPHPDAERLSIVYGAYAPTRRVCHDIRALKSAFPSCRLTVTAGERCAKLKRYLQEFTKDGSVQIMERCGDMASLFRNAHLYIGKAGAATVFEAYSCHLPVIINYTLPGQEQGNLELLLRDGGGAEVGSTSELIAAAVSLIADNACIWHCMRNAMQVAQRGGGAVRIYEIVQRSFFRCC